MLKRLYRVDNRYAENNRSDGFTETVTANTLEEVSDFLNCPLIIRGNDTSSATQQPLEQYSIFRSFTNVIRQALLST